jgi:hypothetical protein
MWGPALDAIRMSSGGECDTDFLNEDELRALGVVVRGEHSYRWE